MIVLDLCKKFCPDKIPNNISRRISDGADGEVFEIDKEDKVIKFCVMYEYNDSNIIDYYNNTVSIALNSLIVNPIHVYARVYAHEYMGLFNRKFLGAPNNIQQFILYYYSMEKLEKISDDESKVFHSILSHEDRGIEKNFSNKKIEDALILLNRGLDFNFKNIMFFCTELKKVNIIHKDIHPRNIMKDKFGKFKLIDFDRIEIRNKYYAAR